MIIIIEGPDCAGKTTLAEMLVDELGADYHHQGPYEGNPMWESIELIESWKEGGSSPNLVLDRFHLGERVYGPIYRDEDKLGQTRQRMLERYLLGESAMLIKALPPEGKALELFRERTDDEMFGDDGEQAYLKQHWLFQAVPSYLPTIHFSFVVDTVSVVIEQIMAQVPDVNLGPGIGDFSKGSILLVGEKQGDREETEVYPPELVFVTSRGDSCAWWLAEQMDDAGLPERGLYWINARTPDGRLEDPYFLDLLKPRKVIALGQEAERWVVEYAGLNHYIRVPHPQHWRRFHHYQEYPLIRELI